MTLDLITQRIQSHQRNAAQISEIVQLYIRDTSENIDARWQIFELATRAHLLPEHSWQQSLPIFDALDVSWYDDFYVDKYKTVEWLDIVEHIEDGGPLNYRGEPNRFYAHIDQIKEEILAAGYWGFINDW